MKFLLKLLFFAALANQSIADTVTVDIDIPSLNVSTYHRPYVAIWLESTQRKGLYNISLWHEQQDWLKDLRQWWRKLGRQGSNSLDGVTGATRKPGRYQVVWQGKNSNGEKFPAGDYYLCIEAVREAGGRDFIRQKISLGQATEQSYQHGGKFEFGAITINVKP